MGDSPVTINFADVWNATKETVSIFNADTAQQMSSRACALPAGVNDPGHLTGWHSEPHRVSRRIYFKPRIDGTWLDDIFDFDDTDIRFGVAWHFGGRYNGQGRYICNAYAWASVHEQTATHNFHITAEFGDPFPVGDYGVMQLPCTIRVVHSRITGVESDIRYAFYLQGDGAGWSEVLG